MDGILSFRILLLLQKYSPNFKGQMWGLLKNYKYNFYQAFSNLPKLKKYIVQCHSGKKNYPELYKTMPNISAWLKATKVM